LYRKPQTANDKLKAEARGCARPGGSHEQSQMIEEEEEEVVVVEEEEEEAGEATWAARLEMTGRR
jgi:hypothetical protein